MHIQVTSDTPIDLQMHTTYSDGRWSAEQLFDYLAEVGFGLVAVTDHDCIETVASIQHVEMVQTDPEVASINLGYRFIGLAYESFGEHQGDEPDFLRAINASQNLLIHWDGKNHLHLGQPHLAENVFMRFDVLDPNMKLPKRIRVEAINNRARMFIAVRNMEQACIYLEVAVKIAVEIGSSLRLQEVAATFQSLKSTWPDEKRVRALGDLFIQYMVNHVH